MRRDMEYTIQLLVDIYKGSYRTGAIATDIEDGVTLDEANENEKYLEHLRLLEEANYVKVEYHYADCITQVVECKLTWDGNDFLDLIENEGIWNKTQEAIKAKGFEVSNLPLDMIVAYAKTKASEILGIQF